MRPGTWIGRRGVLVLAGLACVLATPGVAGAADAGVRLVTGNPGWQPEPHYRSGSDWLALACTATACGLSPARLTVRSKSTLAFEATPAVQGRVLAWLQKDKRLEWLAPGPVVTYGSLVAKRRKPGGEGTLEVALGLPAGGQARLVPLLKSEDDTVVLQLRAAGKRQFLGELGDCISRLSTDYLLWAGDLDRDGMPDYLLDFSDGEGDVVLFLSGAAARGELVGAGGLYNPPAKDRKCEGGD